MALYLPITYEYIVELKCTPVLAYAFQFVQFSTEEMHGWANKDKLTIMSQVKNDGRRHLYFRFNKPSE